MASLWHLASLFTGLLVLGRIAAACWSNVLQKRAINDSRPLGIPPTALELLMAIWTLMTLSLAPWWLAEVYRSTLSPLARTPTGAAESLAFWSWMALACALEVPGNFLLLRSIKDTDLSIFGPLSSYKPIVGMLLGWLILAEMPTAYGALGMLIVLLGSLLLADSPQAEREVTASRYRFGWQHRGVRDRLMAVALTAAGSIYLKLAMQSRDMQTSLAVWSLLSWLLALVWLLSDRSSSLARCWRILKQPNVIAISALMIVMQGLTILVFQAMNVGYALALFQLGSLVSVYLGHRLFNEVDLLRRLFAASIMFVGAVVIVLAG